MLSTPTKIYLARALRDFGDGFVALLLPVYLAARGFDAFEIGLVATLALLGSALTTLAIGLVGARYGQRTLLLAASAVMTLTGLAFAASSVAAVVFLIAFVGTINPSAGSVSIFVPLEHALLAHAASNKKRTKTFARYALIGALAAALGSFAAGTPELMIHAGLSQLEALQAMFLAFAALGLAGGALYATIPRDEHAAQGAAAKPLGPSRAIVMKLTALFAVDSFAGGFAVQSLLALWLFHKFGLSLTAAGTFFLVAGLLGAASLPVAGWLGTRIGLVNTMVWTHIPANLALIAAALAPTLDSALALLAVRALLSQMDVPARTSYVMAVVTPEERTAAASFTAVPRSLAAALSPALAGALIAGGHDAWPLIICGTLKTAYDLTLLATFRNVKPPEEVGV
ncbi:MAG: MFS transporter [Alphaproteobacteria bacterium]|nr:MFS transporter [Alphaproteobacteria bacterium]